ncbi:MAG: sugar phosphorylase, partial [Planctomycetales bacterium]|nr:sugar phosphorylase [Planctomycetales bacterium]
ALYGGGGDAACARIVEAVVATRDAQRSNDDQGALAVPDAWNESDVALITYGDMVREEGCSPLAALKRLLLDCRADEFLSAVHILPFFPYSSDDGFSVIDYRQVDPELGDWDDVAQLGDCFRLGFDLVLNHISQQSEWFSGYLRGEEPYVRYFVECDPELDLRDVVRPRSLPLLTPFETSRGQRWLWTTFSADQLDLNYAEADVMAEMLDVLLDYLRRGAGIVRLDAVAFLWKEAGTRCLHLPKTHEAVKLMRDVLEAAAPHVWLLTETNVPHRENVSYFGNGDEAQLIYQFSLPPLLLDAFVQGDATPLQAWLDDWDQPPEGATYLNFTASHDGVGVRPLEGLVDAERLHALVDAMRARGGLVSTRRQPDGSDAPYEINITYVDALAPDGASGGDDHVRRFLSTQATMLALQGVPAVYFHSLFGTQNDSSAAAATGIARRINRRKFDRPELDRQVEDPSTLSGAIHRGYQRLLEQRRRQPAFAPQAAQHAARFEDPGLFGFVREAVDGRQRILVVCNVSRQTCQIDATQWLEAKAAFDLINDEILGDARSVDVASGQIRWLTLRP